MLQLDNNKLSALFEDFYTLTSIHICLFDESRTEILRYPKSYCGFCGFARQNQSISQKCRTCDNYAFEKCTKTGLRYTYVCHMDLVETATPLLFNGELVGYVMMGQVRSPSSAFDNIADESMLSFKDIGEAKKLYGEIPIVSDRVINAAAHILDACASYLYVSKLVSIQSGELKKRIDEFILENIANAITVDILCRQFHTSRVELYGIFQRLYKKSVALYIKEQRLKFAKNLLTETNYSVGKIAEKSGFNDYNYFSKAFKKYYGVSASSLRR